MPVRALQNLDDAPSRYQGEVRNAAARALRAGARPPLQYIGMGMTGVVFCDVRRPVPHAFKVGRRDTPVNRKMLSEEAEWLSVAATIPEIRANVPRFYRYHRRLNVIERECVRGRSRETRTRDTRREMHESIGRAMTRHGWSAPEYKDDSYVFSSGRGWVLVDASMPHRVGRRLAARAAEVLRGVRFSGESPSDIAWELRMEARKTLPSDFAHRMSDRLLSLPRAEDRSEAGEARDRNQRRFRRRRAA